MLVLSAAVAWAARHQRERAKSSQQQLAQAEAAYGKRVAAVEARFSQQQAAVEATFSQQLAAVEATLGGLVAAIPEAVERVRRGEDALDVSVSMPSLPPFCGPGLTGAYGRLARLVLDAEERSTGTSESVRRAGASE
jgi:hypothetical protein